MFSLAVALALWAVMARPARSAIMATTLAAGVGAVTLAAAITAGYAEQIERLAFGAYARAVVVTENFTIVDRYGPPRLSDLEKLRDGLSQLLEEPVEAAAAWRLGRAQASVGRQRYELDVWGVVGDFQREADMALAAGEGLTPAELESAARRCLIGARAHKELFGGLAESAIGARLRLNGTSCQVAGVFRPADTRTAARYDEAVFAPFTAVARYFEPRGRLGPHEATRLTLILPQGSDITLARSEADRILRAAHGAPLSQPAPFRFVDAAAPIRSIARQRDLVSRLLLAVSVITLVASITGYAGMALGGVEMRRREIAIQMASGALAGDIARQVMLESVLIGLAGGALGLIVGAGLSVVSEQVFGLPAHMEVGIAFLAAGLGVSCGLVAGLAPARRAASEPPAVAMKT